MLLDAWLESSSRRPPSAAARHRPLGDHSRLRTRRKNCSTNSNYHKNTSFIFALQTWFLLLVLITMSQVVLLSRWVPDIIDKSTVSPPTPAAPLINYDDSRRHIENEQEDHQQQQQRQPQQQKAVLIVGGSDGSGTRAIVDMLQRLGVYFVLDEPGTKDVQGEQMFHGDGWPPLVQMVFESLAATQASGGVDYELNHLPMHVRETAIRELAKLQEHLQRNATLSKLESLNNKTSTDGNPSVVESAAAQAAARLVNYGFKAPVTMLLLPLLQHVFGRGPNQIIKFLHVVRDGRDIALSRNKSPVVKFYDAFYGNKRASARRAQLAAEIIDIVNNTSNHSTSSRVRNQTAIDTILSMQLWNDWNTQALHWERQHSSSSSIRSSTHNNNTDTGVVSESWFDFLVVRTEDFVHADTKFQTLLQLSDFVGSTLTDAELCCMSREMVQDLGKSVGGAARRYRQQQKTQLQQEQQQPQQDIVEGDMAHDTRADPAAAGFPYPAIQPQREEKQTQRQLRFARQLEELRKQRRTSIEKDRAKDHAKLINKRYGKWKTALENRPELSALLHAEGAAGLELFGYEPPARFFADDEQTVARCLKCDASVICPGVKQEPSESSKMQSQTQSQQTQLDESSHVDVPREKKPEEEELIYI
jgi:hypothetical protein